MTVLIAGAGIAGLTLGLSLHSLGIPFRVLEAVRSLRPLGVGLNLQPHATRELFELGLEVPLDRVGLRTEGMVYFSANGQEIWREPRGLAAGYDWPQFSIHRGGLQMALHDALRARAGDVISYGAAVTGWRDTATGVEVSLRNRESGACLAPVQGAVVVAADGINSALRAGAYPDEGPAHWRGTMMWRGVTRGPRFLGGRTIAMAGTRSRKFVAYPIGDTEDGGSLINWIADLEMPTGYDWLAQDWNRPGQRAGFAPQFADWQFDWLNVPEIIAGADGIWEFPMVDRNPLKRWSFGPMTLIGDAAHAMYPIGSNGASQAILDARVLAREFCDRGVGPQALAAYEDARREAVNAVVLAGRGDGPDKILDIVAARAPDGFEDIETVMPLSQRRDFAQGYKALAGMDIAALNARPSLIAGQGNRVT